MPTQAKTAFPETVGSAARRNIPAGFESEVRLTCDEVCAITGFSRSMLYREVRAGRFPQPERRGPKWSRWRAGSVIEALNTKAAQ